MYVTMKTMYPPCCHHNCFLATHALGYMMYLHGWCMYSQICSNDHLYKMKATCLRQSMLIPPKTIPIQSLLFKTTNCLTRPATTFFVSQMKKNLSKATFTKLYPVKRWEANARQQCIKNKRLSDYIYFRATL